MYIWGIKKRIVLCVAQGHFLPIFFFRACESESVSCLVLSNSCDPMNYSLPGSSVHGILQARILEWVAISSSRGSS